METGCSYLLDQDSERSTKTIWELNNNYTDSRNVKSFKRRYAREEEMRNKISEHNSPTLANKTERPPTKASGTTNTVFPTKYESHSGIPFVPSPTRPSSNPFKSVKKQKASRPNSKTEVSPKKRNGDYKQLSTETTDTLNRYPFRNAQSKEKKGNAIDTQNPKVPTRKQVSTTQEKQNIFTTPVSKALRRRYADYSGTPFKLKQPFSTSTNPFVAGCSREEPGC